MNFLNKKLKDILKENPDVTVLGLKENPDVTVLGLFWAGYWRFIVIFMALWCAFWFMVGFMGV